MQKQKRIKKDSGVYKITNLLNNKMYIGSSVNLVNRSTNHRKNLKDNKHDNLHLQSSYNKYGGQNFLFEVIEYCNREILIEREQYWIDFYKVTDPKNGYNKRLKADSNFGCKRSPMKQETKEKMRLIGLERSEEVAEWASKFHKGRKRTQETRDKMSESFKGRVMKQESKDKISNKSHFNKKVRNIDTGQIWDSIQKCIDELDISRSTFRNYVKGLFPAKFNLEYI